MERPGDPPARHSSRGIPGRSSRGRQLRAIFRGPGFRRLYATRLSAQLADGVFQVGIASFVFFSPERATTPGRTAATFATLLLPYSLVGPFAGVLIDRWRRQRILVVGNVLRAALVGVVAVLVAADLDDWRFYVASLAVLSVNRFFLSALSAALPHVVAADRLVVANAVSTTSGTLAAVTGAGLGLGVRRLAGGDPTAVPVLLAAATAYLGSALLGARLDADSLGPDDRPRHHAALDAMRHVVREIAAGGRHVWQRRPAGRSLAAIAAHRFWYGLSTIATLLLYRNHFTDRGFFRAGLVGLGQVFFAASVGVVVAALVTPDATRRIGKERWIVTCFATAAVTQVVLVAPYAQPPLLLAAFVSGLVAQGSKICVDTIVQQEIDDAFRGRVFAFYDVLFNVSFVAAATLAALVLPTSGKSYAFLALVTAGYALTAAGYARASRRDHDAPVSWPDGAVDTSA